MDMADIPSFWRRKNALSVLLLPLAYLFKALAARRKKRLQQEALVWQRQYSSLPRIIVVGNISVGGNGKTPVVIALVRALQARGMAVAVISRGYGGRVENVLEVSATTKAALCGDEPKLIAHSVNCPVVVSQKRQLAVEYLLQHYPQTQWIISDDGLQHYALPRDVEWVVVAPDLRLGNGYLLPAGPLREAPQRLKTVDAILFTGQAEPFEIATPQFQLVMENSHIHTLDGKPLALETLQQQSCVALTAIARPERFLKRLSALGINISTKRCLPDHALLPAQVAEFADNRAWIVMTAKDAVKIEDWSDALRARVCVLEYQALLPELLIEHLLKETL